ncbi:hypothetical protein SARC_04693 [Sphaeroforma arctica JP610]|uniref:PROP1-like PPR domain-containing protein n=1 Tax=Sphaeroforma arctica JP610 TaxID=667725 RepID=A0A0L0G2J1_9EUKA|nr:hypothetical protein SARC_04693 [Sphaeroforma arctica JP610]KNC83046.1 hypothetical protein SARC_04693 [Sphaeroforma arctica JP610]|eukprot:XP_014156948.1 hypothetical protein SARC_04693 [Sphaeroforma arctica JP610]
MVTYSNLLRSGFRTNTRQQYMTTISWMGYVQARVPQHTQRRQVVSASKGFNRVRIIPCVYESSQAYTYKQASTQVYVNKRAFTQASTQYQVLIQNGSPPDHLSNSIVHSYIKGYSNNDSQAEETDAEVRSQASTAPDIGVVSKFQIDPDSDSRASTAKKWATAESALRFTLMSGSTPDTVAYNKALSKAGELGLFSDVQRLFHEMVDKRVIRNFKTYEIVSKQASAHGGWEMLLTLLKDMNRSKISKNRDIFTRGLQACSKVRVDKCEASVAGQRLLLEMQKQAGIQIDVADYNYVLKACGTDRKPNMAKRILNDMDRLGLTPNKESYNLVLAACGNGGKFQACIHMLRSMARLGVDPDDTSYHGVMHAIKVHGRWDMALEYLREMHSIVIKPSTRTYNMAIAACLPQERYAEALEIFMEMPQMGVDYDTATYNNVMETCNSVGQWETTQKLFDDMRRRGQAVQGESHASCNSIGPNVTSYGIVLKAYTRTNNLEKALDLVRMGPTDGVVLDTGVYNNVLTLCDKHRRWPEAMSVLRSMEEAQVAYSRYTYNSVISLCRWGGGTSEALGLLRAMVEQGLQPDVYSYTSAISVCQQEGEWETAVCLLKEMHDRGVNPNTYTYNCAITACASADKLERALELFKEMERAGVARDKSTYGVLIECIVRCGGTTALVDTLYDSMTRAVPEVQMGWAKLTEKGELDLHHHNVNMANAAVRRLMAKLQQEQRTAEFVRNAGGMYTRHGMHTKVEKKGSHREQTQDRDEQDAVEQKDAALIGPVKLSKRPSLKRIVVGQSGQVLLEAVRSHLAQMTPPIKTYVLVQKVGCLKLDKDDLARWLLSNK